MKANLHTTTAESLVKADLWTVFSAIGRLLERVWGGRTEVLSAEAPILLFHTVTAGQGSDDVDAWLSWELSTSGSAGWTCVRLVHDEADTSPGPPPELDAVLALLLQEVRTEISR